MKNDSSTTAFRLLRADPEVMLAPLYAPDEAIAELVLGHKAKLWTSELVRQLEREGLPPRRQLLGTMRYVPSVFDFFARREQLRRKPYFDPEDGPENFGTM